MNASALSKTLIRQAVSREAGAPVVLRWTEYPAGTAIDPNTGQMDAAGTDYSCSTRAMVHIVRASTATRLYSEIKDGDAIVDFALPIIRVTAPILMDASGQSLYDAEGNYIGLNLGYSEMGVGSVMDQAAFNRANRTAIIPAVGEVVDFDSMQDVSVEFSGRKWVQQSVGNELAGKWESLFGGVTLTWTMLFRPET